MSIHTHIFMLHIAPYESNVYQNMVRARSSREVTQNDKYHTSPVLPIHNSHGGVCSEDTHLDDDYALGRLCRSSQMNPTNHT